jgi:hypothetical protein
MHSKAQTAVDKVEAERLVNVGQVVCASVGRAGSSSGAMDFLRKHAQPPPTLAQAAIPQSFRDIGRSM